MKDIRKVQPSGLSAALNAKKPTENDTEAKDKKAQGFWKRLWKKINSYPAVIFIKRLIMVLTALSVIGLGLAAAYIGRYETTVFIKQVALIVSGLLAACDGLYLLYKALMKTE